MNKLIFFVFIPILIVGTVLFFYFNAQGDGGDLTVIKNGKALWDSETGSVEIWLSVEQVELANKGYNIVFNFDNESVNYSFRKGQNGISLNLSGYDGNLLSIDFIPVSDGGGAGEKFEIEIEKKTNGDSNGQTNNPADTSKKNNKGSSGGGGGGSSGGGGTSSECNTNSDCSSLNLPSISMCDNVPDTNPFTFDYSLESLGFCSSGQCKVSSQTITHECNKSICNAECDSVNLCSVTECDMLDGCYGEDYRDYVEANNNCLENCECEDNSCGGYVNSPLDLRCASSTCGNGDIDGVEVCDDENINDACSDFGYTGGELLCASDCSRYNFTQCTSSNVISDCGFIDVSGTYVLNSNIIQEENTTCIEIIAENVTIDCKGKSISASSKENIAGIASEGENTRIVNCNISNIEGGMPIYLVGANNSEIYDGNFVSNTMGLFIIDSDNVKIFGNTIGDCDGWGINSGDGIYMNRSLGGRIFGNFLYNNTDANIILHNSSGNGRIEWNRIDGGGDGVLVFKSSDNVLIQNNNIRNSRQGINVQGNESSILNNNLQNLSEWGIVVNEFDNWIKGNVINYSRTGIQIEKNAIVEENFVYNSGSGIDTIGTSSSIIRNNYFEFDGFGVNGGGTPTDLIESNIIKNGYMNTIGSITIGIYGWGMNGTMIRNNTIESYDRGIHLTQYNFGVQLINNTITGCDYGILYGTSTPTNYGEMIFEGNRVCGNFVNDTKCFETASVNGNTCDVNDGCSGECTPCS